MHRNSSIRALGGHGVTPPSTGKACCGLCISNNTGKTMMNFTLRLENHRNHLGSNLLGKTCSWLLAPTPSTHLVLCTLSGPLAIMHLSVDDAIRVWNLTCNSSETGHCSFFGCRTPCGADWPLLLRCRLAIAFFGCASPLVVQTGHCGRSKGKPQGSHPQIPPGTGPCRQDRR